MNKYKDLVNMSMSAMRFLRKRRSPTFILTIFCATSGDIHFFSFYSYIALSPIELNLFALLWCTHFNFGDIDSAVSSVHFFKFRWYLFIRRIIVTYCFRCYADYYITHFRLLCPFCSITKIQISQIMTEYQKAMEKTLQSEHVSHLPHMPLRDQLRKFKFATVSNSV